jgi:Cu(I)/Ag(I) efflux system protein CusF
MRKGYLLVAAMMTASVMTSSVSAQSGLINGQVTKIDESAGKITIRHGPMPKFDLEDGHTMVFRAQDPAILKGVKPGDKIKFEADRVSGQFTVTRIEKAK